MTEAQQLAILTKSVENLSLSLAEAIKQNPFKRKRWYVIVKKQERSVEVKEAELLKGSIQSILTTFPGAISGMKPNNY